MELFECVVRRLNIPLVRAIEYFNADYYIKAKEFVMMMVSINYDIVTLKSNLK